MDDKGVCKDCNNRKYCEDYKPNKWQCEDYEAQHTNEEWLEQASTEEKAKFLRKIYCDGRDDYVGEWYEQTETDFVEWLKEKHE